MVAFNPISPAAARRLVDGVGTDDTSTILADFVEAGLIKAYARVVETLSVGGGRAEVRDARVPRDLWRRIVAEGRGADVWAAGTVRLDGDGMVGGKPAVIITGIRFDERSVRDAANKHAAHIVEAVVTVPARRLKASDAAVSASAASSAEIDAEAPDAPPLFQEPVSAPVAVASKVKRGLAADELCVSVQEAMEIIGVGRTTIYRLRDDDKLVMTKVGGRVVVDADSIRKLLGPTV